ncbi:hypothetical protein ADUPG1_008547 [Aduncisulcus paluster]|uniref:Uncharacterized protein n=1 Tax=Aduncisulcus paluster TaxID=2918883 RepID=A0ABQ5KSD3_9EUKA|nr:hypothetical protein ADUPG1_008547 [Aduncisulcus paluster]
MKSTEELTKKIEALIVSIKRTDSRSAIKSLYEGSYSRLKTIFDEFTSSPSSAVTSARDLFALCFECLSLFVNHKVTKDDGTPDEDDFEVILDSYSIQDMIDSFLPSMIRVEAILRVEREEVKETEAKEEEAKTAESRVNSITKTLFSILRISTDIVDPLCTIVCPKISTLLSKMFIFGLSEKLEDSFVEDILQTCRNIAFAKDDPTKNSLLSILLPHILPWMKKYPDKKFFFLWMNILKNITNDKDNTYSDKDRSSQLWFVFYPILAIIKDTASKGITFYDDAVICCLCFFGNLSCIPSQAIEVHDCIKEGLLDSWFEIVKRKKSEGEVANCWGIKYWSRLISMISTVTSLISQLSPKYDANMEWCKKNGGWSEDYARYFGNCYPSLKKWSGLVEAIKKCPDSESSSILYHKHRGDILSVFLASQSKSEIEEHKREIVLCVECLDWFVGHTIAGRIIYLPIPDLNNLIDTFIDHLSRVEEILEEAVYDEYCSICVSYSFKVKDKRDSFLPKILSTFHRILERGSKEKLSDNIVLNSLITLKNISISPSTSTRSSIFTLIKPLVKDWLRMYNDCECYGQWMFILSQITLSSDNESPNTSLCSEAWPLFHPVLDVVKREFVGDKIVEDDHEYVLRFFSNLCCDPSHALVIYDNIKHLLDGWFEVMKRKEHKWGIIFCSKLISMLSAVPSLVPQLSPKYDANMEWCKKNGEWSGYYARYLGNCYPSLKKWSGLVEAIKKCPDSESSSILYHKHRGDILSVFLASQSKSEIEEHKREIVLCVECLRWFVRHAIAGRSIYLPIPDLNNLIDTFIDHLLRIEEILEEAVDEKHCSICVSYSFKVKDKWDSFLPKILSTFHRILERGSKEKLSDNIVRFLSITLRNISSSPSTSTRSSILTLIKPYIRDWLRMYNDSNCYGQWMFILSQITLSSDNESPNKSLCSEVWPLSHPVLDLVKREFVGDRIIEYGNEFVLLFFSNLCCDPSHALVIYDNVKHLLDSWFEVMKRKQHKWGIKYWFNLISMLSTVPSLVPQLSPKYDAKMLWCKGESYCSTQIYNQYLSNISSFVSSSYLSSTLFHSVPMVSFLPSIETSLCPEKDGYSYSSHVCSVMNLHKTPDPSQYQDKISCYHDIISGKEMQIQHVLKCDGSSSQDILTHSSLIQYTSPPQHMLVKMPFDDERSLRQSVHDLIERTGGGVEVMFEQGSLCYSFEEYDQEAWRKRMEDIEEDDDYESEEEYASDISVESSGD